MVSWLPLYHDISLVGCLAIPMTAAPTWSRRPRRTFSPTRVTGCSGSPTSGARPRPVRTSPGCWRRALKRMQGSTSRRRRWPCRRRARRPRSPSRRSSPPRQPFGFSPAACSRRSGWPRWRSAARSRRGRGLVCDTVDRVVSSATGSPSRSSRGSRRPRPGHPSPPLLGRPLPGWRCASSIPDTFENAPSAMSASC